MDKRLVGKICESGSIITADSLNKKLSKWSKYGDKIAGSSWAGATTIYKFEKANEVGFKVEIGSEGAKSCLFYFRFASFVEDSAKYIHALALKSFGKDKISYTVNKDNGKDFYLVEYTHRDPSAMVSMLRLSPKNEEKVVKFINDSFTHVDKTFK